MRHKWEKTENKKYVCMKCGLIKILDVTQRNKQGGYFTATVWIYPTGKQFSNIRTPKCTANSNGCGLDI